jgi:hypothetical protein
MAMFEMTPSLWQVCSMYVSVGPGALSCYGAHQAYILRPIHPFTRRESEIMGVGCGDVGGGEGGGGAGGGAAGSPHLNIYSYTLDKASLPLRALQF